MVLAIMERGAKEITEAVVKLAKEGDLSAARLVIERLLPPAKDRPIFLELPDSRHRRRHRSGSGGHRAGCGCRRAVARRRRYAWPVSWKSAARHWRRKSLNNGLPHWRKRNEHST
jgi:hypothetical protein